MTHYVFEGETLTRILDIPDIKKNGVLNQSINILVVSVYSADKRDIKNHSIDAGINS